MTLALIMTDKATTAFVSSVLCGQKMPRSVIAVQTLCMVSILRNCWFISQSGCLNLSKVRKKSYPLSTLSFPPICNTNALHTLYTLLGSTSYSVVIFVSPIKHGLKTQQEKGSLLYQYLPIFLPFLLSFPKPGYPKIPFLIVHFLFKNNSLPTLF